MTLVMNEWWDRCEDETNVKESRITAKPDVIVRRAKALDHSGCKSHPGTGSLRPVAIEGAEEVTNLLKPLV